MAPCLIVASRSISALTVSARSNTVRSGLLVSTQDSELFGDGAVVELGDDVQLRTRPRSTSDKLGCSRRNNGHAVTNPRISD